MRPDLFETPGAIERKKRAEATTSSFMSAIVDWTPGGFAYLPGGPYPFSSGIAAGDGYALCRVRFRRPLPVADGLAAAAAFIAAHDRPTAAFAACELRAPAALSRAAFTEFNGQYRDALRANGFGADAAYPIARSNLAPLVDPPGAATLHAFTYTVADASDVRRIGRDVVVSGMPELAGDPPAVVAPGDVSVAGLRQKASAVIAELRRRVALLDANWNALTAAQIYTLHSFDAVRDLLIEAGLARDGLTLVPSAPPVVGFDFEADVRNVTFERVL